MRFGISLISWMLPKILRMRRELLVRAMVGTSFCLVAILFPALRARVEERGPYEVRRGFLEIPPHSFGPLRGVGPWPGEDRKGPGRTSPCGGAVKCWIERIYAFLGRVQGVNSLSLPEAASSPDHHRRAKVGNAIKLLGDRKSTRLNSSH